MVRAIWNGVVIAESENTIQLEGNHYFPESDVKKEFLKPSDHTSVCPWKGTASYYNVLAKNGENSNAAWYYPKTSDMASKIKGYIA